MRIALIRQKYDPFGGAEKFVQTAVEALAAQHAQLTIITRAWPAQAAAGVDHRIVNPAYHTSTGRDRGFAEAVHTLLAQENFDLVQSHERIAGCDIYRAGDGVHAEWLKQRSRVVGPFKKLSVALSPHHRYLLRTERAMFAAPQLKKVICNSRMVYDEIQHYFDVPAEKLQIIYSGVDIQKFQPTVDKAPYRKQFNLPNTAPILGFVGSGFERKGLAAFLQALAQVPDAHGLVVGKDKKMRAYQRLAHALGLGERVHFTGGLHDMRPAYAAMDGFVLPTLYDPLPNACLEAMACGLPVVTSTKSGAAELITEGVNGFVCDALDVSGLVKAMIETLKSAEEMGVAARTKVASYTANRMAQEYIALYREVLGACRT